MLKEWIKGEACVEKVVVFLHGSCGCLNKGMKRRKEGGIGKKESWKLTEKRRIC